MRLALGVEYDGSDFCGWQRQSGTRTVQGCVEKALSQVADHELAVVCAGRTDAGVHATGQVVHFDTDAIRDQKGWIRGTNANLPRDVRVHWVTEINDDFHARFAARRRYYRYVIHNQPVGMALLRKRVCWDYAQLDESSMAIAAAYLVGEHDFTSFRAVACQANSPVRTIYRLDVIRCGNFIYIDIVANAFLHHMVRCIAGVLMTIGHGDQSCEWITELLAAKDRALSGMTAPAAGLYLVNVQYPEHCNVPSGGWAPVYG
jgi:tRNA pseudouridine38-40 synthase